MIFHEFHWITPCLFWQTSPRMQKPHRAIGTRWGWGDRPSLRGAQFDGRRNPPEALTGKMLRKTLVGCHICICWFYMTLYDVYSRDMFIHHEMYIIIYIYIIIIFTYVLNIHIISDVETWMESSIVLWLFIYRTAYKYMYIANTWTLIPHCRLLGVKQCFAACFGTHFAYHVYSRNM